MSYLVDTNVLSELRRKQPDRQVADWFAARPVGILYISVLTLGEIRKGIESCTDKKRRGELMDWLETELCALFAGRILPISHAVADRWGHLVAQAGRPLPAIDSLLAATAIEHGLILISRNVKDFEGLSLDMLNPWEA